MSDDIAIRVNRLGKKYRISHETASYKTLGETITRAVKAPFRRLTGEAPSRSTEEFWALKDVSFEVKRGEVVGIIGRNGAGKSTLLKILSRITTPTEGTVEVHGRIGSLLEVGTGFHPELSGRENIYLSGSILGMKRTEIDAKFDEIVKFAEMEKFLDTPVKRYSSGMYVRLAFAVAAHLEPEILIVDEVLAVGDAAFQKKCLGKMGDVAKEGRTVLFVSHNMSAIKNICQTGMILENGKVRFKGDINHVIQEYLVTLDSDFSCSELIFPEDNLKPLQIIKAKILGGAERDNHFIVSEELNIEISGVTRRIVGKSYISINVLDIFGNVIYWTSDIESKRFSDQKPGNFDIICEFPKNLLTPGRYLIDFAIVSLTEGVIDHYPDKKMSIFIEDDSSWLKKHGVEQPGWVGAKSNWIIK